MNNLKLPNFKALQIERDMIQEFSYYQASDLNLLIESSYFQNPYITKRKENEIYCNVRVVDCENEYYWYRNLIGFDFFCKIIYKNYGYGKFISEFTAVKLTGTKEIKFRSFSAKDVSII